MHVFRGESLHIGTVHVPSRHSRQLAHETANRRLCLLLKNTKTFSKVPVEGLLRQMTHWNATWPRLHALSAGHVHGLEARVSQIEYSVTQSFSSPSLCAVFRFRTVTAPSCRGLPLNSHSVMLRRFSGTISSDWQYSKLKA